MEEWGVEAWVTLTRDPCDDMTNVIWERDIQLDPIAEYIGAEQVTVPAAFIFTTSGRRIAIAGAEDARYIRDTGIYQEVLTYTYNRAEGRSGFGRLLGQSLSQLDPATIGLNYSTEEGVADGLTVGMKMIFDAAVGPELASRVVSAERVIISMWNRKVAEEVRLIEKSAVQSARLTDEALRAIQPGVTTARGLFDDIRCRMAELGLEPGWQEYWSPTVTVSEFRLAKPPADRVIERGDLVVVNSGFLVEGHMSDVNRMAYVLREDENVPPPLIQKLFDTGLASTRAGVAAIRPGATGEQVDAAARSVVVDAGFDEYGHATGHTTGVWVHGLGVIIGPALEGLRRKGRHAHARGRRLRGRAEPPGALRRPRRHYSHSLPGNGDRGGGRGAISHRAGDGADVDQELKNENSKAKRPAKAGRRKKLPGGDLLSRTTGMQYHRPGGA